MSTEVDYNEVSFVISSGYREAVMVSLLDGFKTPSEISEDTEKGIAHVSRSLKALKERDLVELIVDEDTKKGRLYRLTDNGRDVADSVKTRE